MNQAVNQTGTGANAPVSVNNRLLKNIKEVSAVFSQMGNKKVVSEIDTICRRGVRNRFSVAVVGEFSRGKSTFVNTLIGKDILPVGNMPTTAMLTRIRYNKNDKLLHFGLDGSKGNELPLNQDSWDGLVAENFGKSDPEGTVLVGVDCDWIGKYNIEILDTPGAGDLEEKRAQVIGDALLGSDGAIITITATSALSMSEKLFIEQRLLARKTPFLMLIVTKLDVIPKRERNTVIRYIIDKLASWNMDIPVYIPYDVETVDDTYKDIIGLDKVKNQILAWINAPERVKYTEDWITAQAISVVQRELASLEEQKMLLDCDESRREKLVAEKKQKLINAENTWGQIRLQMLERSSKCYDLLKKKADEFVVSMTERLQYEASHSNAPQKWWESDYPYRLKVELTNMSSGIENAVSRVINDDVRWFNTSLENNFKTQVMYEREVISDRDTIVASASTSSLEFQNLDKQRVAVKIGTVALSIAGYAVCAAAGFVPLIATMGIGTGSSLISESVFKKKIEAQKEDIKQAIAKDIPKVVSDATEESELRVKSIYDGIIKSAVEKEQSWTSAQVAAIEKGIASVSEEEMKAINEQISRLNSCLAALQ